MRCALIDRPRTDGICHCIIDQIGHEESLPEDNLNGLLPVANLDSTMVFCEDRPTFGSTERFWEWFTYI